MKARARIPIPPQRRSKTEEAWENLAILILEDEFKLRVIYAAYEPLTFNIPGGKYTPDFLYLLENGEHVLIEVKSKRRLQSYRDSRAKLRAAAELYPFYHWFMATAHADAFVLERIGE